MSRARRTHTSARTSVLSLAAVLSVAALVSAGGNEVIVADVNGEDGDRAGNAVAIEGDWLVVGALQGGEDNAGSAAVFRRQGCDWFQLQTLENPDEDATGGAFGWAIEMEGDTLVVSALGAALGDLNSVGLVYVYERTGDIWELVQTLEPPAPASNSEFGELLSLDGDHLAVGSPSFDDPNINQGQVVVFVRNAGVWEVEDVIVPDVTSEWLGFGVSVALDGDTLAVGANPSGTSIDPSGAAYVFTSDAGVWTQQAKIFPPDTDVNDAIGSDVDVEGDTLLIGAYGDDHSGIFNVGSAFVYTRDTGVWSLQQQLISETPLRNSYFGEFVELEGDLAVIAAPRTTVDPDANAGEVHRFVRSGDTWTFTSKLSNPDPALGRNFGEALDVNGDDLAVGWDGYSNQIGAAVVFQEDVPAVPPTAFIAPKKVTLNLPAVTKKAPDPGFSASGTLDTGVDAVDLTQSGTLVIGTREITFASGLTLSGNGKKYEGESGGASITLTPDKKGSSEHKLDVEFNGDLTGDAAPDGALTIGYSTDEFDAEGTVVLDDGSFKRGKVPANVTGPALDVRKAKATLKGLGKDKLDLTLGFASGGTAPVAPTDFEIVFGAFTATVPASEFVAKKKEKVEFKGEIDGVKKIAIDYAKGEIKITLRKTTLGPYAENGAPALVRVTFDLTTRPLAFRLGGTGTKTRKY